MFGTARWFSTAARLAAAAALVARNMPQRPSSKQQRLDKQQRIAAARFAAQLSSQPSSVRNRSSAHNHSFVHSSSLSHSHSCRRQTEERIGVHRPNPAPGRRQASQRQNIVFIGRTPEITGREIQCAWSGRRRGKGSEMEGRDAPSSDLGPLTWSAEASTLKYVLRSYRRDAENCCMRTDEIRASIDLTAIPAGFCRGYRWGGHPSNRPVPVLGLSTRKISIAPKKAGLTGASYSI